MKIYTFTEKAMSQNNYLCVDEATGEAVLIDCGQIAAELNAFLRENPVRLTKILLTHGHFDHTLGAEAVIRLTGAALCADADESALLADPRVNVSALVGAEISLTPDETFEDGDIITFGKESLRVIRTPGHTAGSVCFYNENDGILFSGDTLFRDSVGRTDLPTSDAKALAASVRSRLYVLPPETTVYPGHAEATTIGREKAGNPIVRGI